MRQRYNFSYRLARAAFLFCERRLATANGQCALLIGEPVTVATHDSTMKAVAEHLGLLVTDPVEHRE